MGLFSSKYVTNVATTVSRVIEDHSLPNSVKHGAIKGLLANDDQFVENVLEEVIGSVGIRADRLYTYGKNNYLYGLPSGAIQQEASGTAVVQATIAGLVGQAVTLDYYHFGALNNLHVGWVKLMADHAYSPNTNQIGDLTAAKGKPVYLTNVAVVVTEATLLELSNGSLEQWGEPADTGSQDTGSAMDAALRGANALKKRTLFELDATAPNDYLRVDYRWTEDTTAVVEGVTITRPQSMTGSFNIPFTGYDQEADWHQARYTRADGQIGYWLYQAHAGTYPAVDALHNPLYTGNGSYFPFGYFRFAKVSGLADKTSNWYKHSKKMMNYVNLDYDQVTEAIHANPDIDQVEQAMLMVAVPAVTSDPTEQRYLFDYFTQMLDLTENKVGGHIQDMLNGSRAATNIVIQDARFKMALGYSHIYKKIVHGNIGSVGSYTSGLGSDTQVVTGINTEDGGPVNWSTAQQSHFYRHQISETQYQEIRVTGLKMTYYIFEQYTTVGDENDPILLIPIDRSISKRYSIPERETLYARSLHYVFNSRVITKIKWYQTGFFKILMVIVAIVIAFFSEQWQLVGAALAAGTLTIEALVYALLIGVIKYLVIGLAIKLFVKVVGVKVAFIVAIVAALAGVYQTIDAGSIQAAPWAKDLLQLSTGLTKGINLELQREFADLKTEVDEFSVFATAQEKRLDDAQKLLDNSNWAAPFIVFGEKPDDYYQRTVHSGNIGVLGLDAISAYVDVALTLPKLSETL
jgi:hypothetical protein